jgi:hypothetical protein
MRRRSHASIGEFHVEPRSGTDAGGCVYRVALLVTDQSKTAREDTAVREGAE